MREKIIFTAVITMLLLAFLMASAYATPVNTTVKVIKDGKEITGAYIEVWNASLIQSYVFDRDKLITKGLSPLNVTLETGQNYIIYAAINGTTYEWKFKNFTGDELENGTLTLKIKVTTRRASMNIVYALAGALGAFILFALVARGTGRRRGRRR